ncbi:MAG: NADH:ubiquinone oxidoreductase subunit NDUFA12 [Alphaproteobacteria bacterium]|nr:MAG: NADH:ubiquinone oxidoreductase subunit NDUFA12 [Alphaproteobacteria bacterium]
MEFLKKLVTWWNGSTLGTLLYTWRHGVLVGEDQFGNRYYRSRDGKRRWVIYAGEAEASTVPPDWHGWLHFTWDEPPTERPLPHKPWEKPHRPNPTGTPEAHIPAGSILRPQPVSRRSYEPWQPE